ncbi:MAG: DUF4340 domain-containing protein [Candidatus Tectomicrobia bacterium]|nr:DUF4340 domain-containing protein [Candidatus Tectomicrobia bacterium]
MKRGRLVVVWLVFVVLVGAVIVIERAELMLPEEDEHGHAAHGGHDEHDEDDEDDEHGEDGIRMLMPAPLAELTAVEIGFDGALHRFERDVDGVWFYHTHDPGAEPAENHEHKADAAFTQRIDLALAAFGRTRIERDFELARDAETYGIASPDMIILVYGSESDAPLAQYTIGDLAPDTFSRYVQAAGHDEVVTIPDYQITNLRDLISSVTGQSDG